MILGGGKETGGWPGKWNQSIVQNLELHQVGHSKGWKGRMDTSQLRSATRGRECLRNGYPESWGSDCARKATVPEGELGCHARSRED